MAILIDKKTNVVIQGITGKEGSRACAEMMKYGTRVLAGVTPGKGGQKVEGVPVYDTVAEAVTRHPGITAALITVPASTALDACLESIAAGIPLINILTEHVPVRDCSVMFAAARRAGARVVGPSSVGIIVPGVAKVGSVGAGGIDRIFTRGSIGVISKSGGMTAEVVSVLHAAGLGESTAVGIGGDQIIGSDFVDLLELFEKDKQTLGTVIFGEIGGTYEERVAHYVAARKIKKPIVAVIAGKFTATLPQGTVLGHAGAIVARGRGGYASKVNALRRAGVLIAPTLDEIPLLLRKALGKKIK